MTVDRKVLARARMALQEARRGYLFDPNVNLIDFGYPEHGGEIADDELAIRFHVQQKLSGVALEMAERAGETRAIPESIGGFATDVPEGDYRLQRWQQPVRDPRAHKNDPLCGGISISNASQNGYGTLGGFVRDRQSGAGMILSNYHVLCNAHAPWRVERIYQPGRLDRGTHADTIGELARNAMGDHLDAAVARLSNGRTWINNQLGVGRVTGVGQPELGMEVVKSGRRTGITYGRITAVEGTAKIRYGRTNRVIEYVVTVEPRHRLEEVSAPGDSGSWWLDTDSRRVVALHFAGSNSPERALALEIQPVLDALDVELDLGARPAWLTRSPAWHRS